MSHYARIKIDLKDRQALVEALLKFGYTRDQIEVHDQAQPLYDYNGAQQSQCAHVIVRKRHVGDLCNDMGWVVDPTGKHSAWHVCDYARNKPGKLFNPKIKALGGHNDKFASQLDREYKVAVATRKAKADGKKVTRVDSDDGKILLYAY